MSKQQHKFHVASEKMSLLWFKINIYQARPISFFEAQIF